jgi:hypothetical protein
VNNPHPTFDSILDLCRNQHRRIVLGILAAEQRSVTLDDLTETVLKYNHHTPLTKAPDDVLAETRTLLHHHHLPKLTSEGLITYDPDREHVAATEQFEQVQPTVSTILDADPKLEAPIEL